jgi:hypothetical protein
MKTLKQIIKDFDKGIDEKENFIDGYIKFVNGMKEHIEEIKDDIKKLERNKMKTNEEYWKQRCLLAESMLEAQFNSKGEWIDNPTPTTVSPFVRFQWNYVRFKQLLKDNKLQYLYEGDSYKITVLHKTKKVEPLFVISGRDIEEAYQLALETLEIYLEGKL